VGETTNASSTSGIRFCSGRPYNILELALHGVPAEVLDVLLERCGVDGSANSRNVVEREPSVPITVTFVTPTSARRCSLTVVGGADDWSVARFSTVWPSGDRRLPSESEISHWNELAPAGQKMMRRADGSITLYLDLDIDDISLQQVIPLWLRWDHTVETARDFIVFGVV
jgi:hypothetical protein